MKRTIKYFIFLLLLYPAAAWTTVIPIEEVKKDPKASVSGATIEVTVRLKNKAGTAKQTGEYKALVGDLPFMAGRAEAAGIQNLTADAEGKCAFENIERGSYLLYAGYYDDAHAGYWLLPVTVGSTKKKVLMLTEKNMTESVDNK